MHTQPLYLRTAAQLTRARCQLAIKRHRQQATKNGATLDYGILELVQLAERVVQCKYCLMPLDWSAEFDHFQATSRGGKHALSNLVVAHAECNRAKGMMNGEEYLALLKLLDKFHPMARSDVLRRLRAGGTRYRGGK